MKIVICGPAKTGNHWLRFIFGHLYNLTAYKRALTIEELAKIPDNTISIHHFYPTDEFFNAVPDAYVFTIIRDPYDTFVSTYFYANNFQDIVVPPGDLMFGKNIQHPDVLTFLADHFGNTLQLAADWVECNKTRIVRYENLHKDCFNFIKTETNSINPSVTDIDIQKSILFSDVDRIRKMGVGMKKHMRKSIVGDWKNHLTRDHLNIMKDKFGDLISRLGYDVIDPSYFDEKTNS